MKRRYPSSLNIWPGFVDVISTLLLVFVFLLALFMISQTFLTQALSGKNTALDNLKEQLARLDKDLESNKSQKDKLSDLLINLNEELEKLNLNKISLEKELSGERQLTKKYLLSTKELEAKVKLLFDDLGVANLKINNEKELNAELNMDVNNLNKNIKKLNSKLLEVENALDLSMEDVKNKNVQVKDLNKKLNIAIKDKIGELAEFRSEFFGRLKKIIGDEEQIIVVGDRFVLQSEIFFSSGSALIEDKGTLKIIEIANLLKSITSKIPENIDWLIQVEGHTDNIPISNKDYPSNWELSTARAISVAKIMINNGIEPNRINVAGYGEFRPLVDNKSKIDREKNRRIELKLTQP